MKFLMQGLEIDTDTVKNENELGDILAYLTMTYYPEMGAIGVGDRYDKNKNIAKIYFRRDRKYYMQGEVLKDIDCEFITGLPEDYFYLQPGVKPSFMLLGYAGSYYVSEDEIKRAFMCSQAVEGVKDIKFFPWQETLTITVIGEEK